MRRLVFSLTFFGWVVSLSCHLWAQEDADSKPDLKQRVEDAALEYTMSYADLERYVASAVCQEEEMDEDDALAKDMQATFAVSLGKSAKDQKRRFDIRGNLVVAGTDEVQEMNERVLKVDDHHWIERYGHIYDVHDLDVDKGDFTPVKIFDPYALPIDYATSLGMGSSLREVVNYMMPSGRLFSVDVKEGGKLIGRWWHGTQRLIGYTEIMFYPEFNLMPVDFRDYIKKVGRTDLDKNDYVNTTQLYQHTQTKWKKHATGKYLPVEINCGMVYPYQLTWRVDVEWWLDNEVPDQIFTLEDFKKGYTATSLLDQMVAERKAKGAGNQQTALEAKKE